MTLIGALILAIILNVPMMAEIHEDYYQIKRTGKDDHNKDVWIRVWCIGILSSLCGYIKMFLWGSHHYIISALSCALFAVGCYALFDPILNICRGLDWDYLGNTATTDKFLNQFHPAIIFIARIVFLFGGIAIFITL